MDGDEIKALRQARGLTQPELAKALKVSVGTVSNWETGATAPRNREGMIRRFFARELREKNSGDPLRAFSDVALLSELLRRAVARPDDEL